MENRILSIIPHGPPWHFSLTFPRWEHFYGNRSPWNKSSSYVCAPDSLMMSRALEHRATFTIDKLMSLACALVRLDLGDGAAAKTGITKKIRYIPATKQCNFWHTVMPESHIVASLALFYQGVNVHDVCPKLISTV